jgi:fucose 4-O-acetylase-like acetyltransferase
MERNVSLDIMKGIAMLAVIAGHTLPIDDPWCRITHTFNLPVFFIVAGYLYKPSDKYKQKFVSDFKRLIIPYLVIAVAFTVYLLIKESDTVYALKYSVVASFFASACNHHSMFLNTAPRIGAAWFLPALFWCRQLFNIVQNKSRYPSFIIVLLALSATIIDYYLINLPLGVLPGMSTMIFYLIGYKAKYIVINKKATISLVSAGTVCWLLHFHYSYIEMCICAYGLYPVDIVACTFASWIIYHLSIWLSKTPVESMLSEVGKLSLYIYAFHVIELEVKPYRLLSLPDVWYMEMPIRIAWCIAAALLYNYILSPLLYLCFKKTKIS